MMSCWHLPLGTMLCVLCTLQFMFYFYMACGCIVEESIALMRIRASLVEANSSRAPPTSWGQTDDCCSWERVKCNNNTRVSDLNLTNFYVPLPEDECGCWYLNLTIFSSFHELQGLDLFQSGACFQNFEGLQGLTKLQHLNLSENNLDGNNNILEYLGKLSSLEVINIEKTCLSGALQNIDFRTLKNLRELRLGTNYLNGSIPASLFELPHLESLDLSQNLLRGRIPITSSSNLSSSLHTLKLSSNYLNGTFDFFWLRNCAKLKDVYLSWNSDLAIDVKFRRRMPPFQLRVLMLSQCKLDNSIITGPNFLVRQHHLEVLHLQNNKLTGSIPSWILAKVSLVDLNLANNSLVGSLDSMWQYKSNLEMIDISTNNFNGQLPTNVSSVFPHLVALDTSYNNISGDLPPSLCKISSLRYMDLSNNEFTGEVPTCLFTDCFALKKLVLSKNNLSGPILGKASNLSFISDIRLDRNNFKGALPNNIVAGNLEIMDLHDNKLSGELDVSFWNLPRLKALSVASNSLTGKVYPDICKLTGLQFLDMSDNKFAGSIPNCGSKLTLKFLNMSSNSLSSFPGGFLNSHDVVALDLRYNMFKGTLDWIQHLSQLKMLLLGRNRFEGQISSNLCHLKYLNILDLSHNKLSGLLPPCIGGISFGYHPYDLNFWSLISTSGSITGEDGPYFSFNDHYDRQAFTFSTKGNLYTYGCSLNNNLMSGIDLSANMLSGEIPWEIGNLSHVKSLNLSHNSFTGRIPTTFANMSSTESMDMSYNELSGSIPWELTKLSSLEVFLVAYNNLSGCIPNSGQFGSFIEESYTGNINLHNLSQGHRCFPVPDPVEEDVGESSDDPILYIISAASFVLAFWITVTFLFCHSFGQHVVLQL